MEMAGGLQGRYAYPPRAVLDHAVPVFGIERECEPLVAESMYDARELDRDERVHHAQRRVHRVVEGSGHRHECRREEQLLVHLMRLFRFTQQQENLDEQTYIHTYIHTHVLLL